MGERKLSKIVTEIATTGKLSSILIHPLTLNTTYLISARNLTSRFKAHLRQGRS